MPSLFPVQERELYIVKEAVPGTIPASAPGTPVPFTALKPSNKPLWLDDDSLQGSMGDVYGVYQGPLIAAIDLGGYVFGDTFGHFLLNLLGDLTSTGTTVAPTATTNSAIAAGVLALPVASGGASFTNGMFVQLVDTGNPPANEIVTVGSGSTATSIVLTTATRFAHASGTVVNNTSAPYVHNFALLNGLIGAPYAGQAAQPATHTITDRTGIPVTGLADQYSYTCLSELVITGNSEKLLAWTAKAACQTRQVPGSAVALANVSTVQTYPSWRSVTGIGGVASGGTQVKDVAEWMLTLTRSVKPYNTDQGAQTPFAIGRGKQGVQFKLTLAPSIDDSQLTNLLTNVQPQLQFVASNGLAGANLVQVQADVGLGAYLTADINDASELFGYDVAGKCPHTAATFTGPQNSLLSGASGGKSAIKIALTCPTPMF